MKILFLTTDAYGGSGGIAYYNRCLAEALVKMHVVEQLTILPRIVKEVPVDIPAKVSFKAEAAGSKALYLRVLATQFGSDCDLIICGHINLLPLATAMRLIKRKPLVLQVHGIEVWETPPVLSRLCLMFVNTIWTVSALTRDRMNAWARMPDSRYIVLPNTFKSENFGMAPKRQDLMRNYGLIGKKVILTLARLEPTERYKGIDEILEVLPLLIKQEPELIYLIAGTGEDGPRLSAKVKYLGLDNYVKFLGYISETDKADILRLADTFVMPGRGEGFGIVYLEALACGTPVVGSLLDGSQEALRQGQLGELVDPRNPKSLIQGIRNALQKTRKIHEGLDYFAWPAFSSRVAKAVEIIQKET